MQQRRYAWVIRQALAVLALLAATAADAFGEPVDPLVAPSRLPDAVSPPPAVPPPLPVYPRLALLETALALGGGIIWYRTDGHSNAKDWDYDWSWSTWKKRVITFEAVRFDDNAFRINALVHPLDGTGIYLIARGNRLSPLPSFLLTLAESTIWEFVVEYREVVSINDMIFTPVTGLAIGEPMVRLSNLLRAGDPGSAKEVLATLLNPIDAVNRWFEGGRPARAGPTDAHGLPLLYRHRLQLSAGVGHADFGSAGSWNEIGARADLFVDATPTLSEPARRAGFVGPGALDWLVASISGNSNWQSVDGRIQSEVALGGWLLRQTLASEGGQPTSSSILFLGFGTAFEYESRSSPRFTDELGVVRLAGPLVDWGLRRGKLDLHVVGDIFYDFAMVRSLALDDYLHANGGGALSSVLAQQGYYFAQGVSSSLRVILEFDRLEIGGAVTEDDFWSIRGRDRFQPPEREPAARDRRGAVRAWWAVRPWSRSPLRALLAFDRVTREGRFASYDASLSEMRVSTALDLKF
jgi:hypothetical protein